MALLTQEPGIYDPEEQEKDRFKPPRSPEERPAAGPARPGAASRTSSRDMPHRSRQPRHRHTTTGVEKAEQASLSQGADGPEWTGGSKAAQESSAHKGRFRGFVHQHKRKLIAGALGGSLLGYGGFLFLSGPLLPIHFAQTFDDHNFGILDDESLDANGRIMSRLLFKGTAGRGLSVKENLAANRFEKKLRQAGYDIDTHRTNTGRIERIITPDGLDIGVADLRRGEGRRLARNIGRSLKLNKVLAFTTYRPAFVKRNIGFRFFRKADEKVGNTRTTIREKLRDIVKGRGTSTDLEVKNSAPGENNTEDIGKQGQERVENGESPNKAAKNLRPGVAGAGAASIFLMGCTIRDKVAQGEQIAHETRAKPAMTMGLTSLAAGHQEEAGDIASISEVGEFAQVLNGGKGQDVDKDGAVDDEETGFAGSAAYQRAAERDQITGPDLPQDLWPTGAIFAGAMDFFNSLDGFDTVCDALNSVINDVPGLNLALQGAGLFFAPVSTLASFGFDQAWPSIVKAYIGEGITGNETGALFANIADMGLNLAASDMSRKLGGTAVDVVTYEQLRDQHRQLVAKEESQKSLYERYFALSNYRSAASRLAQQAPRTPQQLAAAIIKLPSSATHSLASLPFTHKVKARTPFHNYDIQQFGFRPEEMDDPRFEDPGEVANHVDTLSEEQKTRYRKCLDGDYLEVKADAQCSKSASEDVDFAYFRFDRLYAVNLDGLDCAVSDDEACLGQRQSGGGGNVDCSAAQGNEKILCAAKGFHGLPYVYGGGRPAAKWVEAFDAGTPLTAGPDCSGLINISIYRAFGVELNHCSASYLGDAAHFKTISPTEARPGDIALYGPCSKNGHVALVHDWDGQNLQIYHTRSRMTNGVGGPESGNWMLSRSGFTFVRYIGPGSSP